MVRAEDSAELIRFQPPKCCCNWKFCRNYQASFKILQHPLFHGIIELRFARRNAKEMLWKQCIERILDVDMSNRIGKLNYPFHYYVAKHHFTEETMMQYAIDPNALPWHEYLRSSNVTQDQVRERLRAFEESPQDLHYEVDGDDDIRSDAAVYRGKKGYDIVLSEEKRSREIDLGGNEFENKAHTNQFGNGTGFSSGDVVGSFNRGHNNGPPSGPPAPEVPRKIDLSLEDETHANVSNDTDYVTKKNIFDPYGEKGVYTGALSRSTGMPNGKGRMEYEKEGRSYDGDWVLGCWTGVGRLFNGDGDFYEGGFKNDQKHGTGVMKFADGRMFQGEYICGQMIQGQMIYEDGSIYDGSWEDGMRHGRGKCVFVDGSEYEGEFEEGVFHGHGMMTWNDGGWYVGDWCDGEIHGKGKEIRPDGSLRHDGDWNNGRPIRSSHRRRAEKHGRPIRFESPHPIVSDEQDTKKTKSCDEPTLREEKQPTKKKSNKGLEEATKPTIKKLDNKFGAKRATEIVVAILLCVLVWFVQVNGVAPSRKFLRGEANLAPKD